MGEDLIAVLEFHRRREPRRIGVHLQRPFGQLDPQRRQPGDQGTQFDGPVQKPLGVHGFADQSTAVGLLGRDHPAGEHPVGRDAGADDSRQVVAHPHLGTRQAKQDGRIAE